MPSYDRDNSGGALPTLRRKRDHLQPLLQSRHPPQLFQGQDQKMPSCIGRASTSPRTLCRSYSVRKSRYSGEFLSLAAPRLMFSAVPVLIAQRSSCSGNNWIVHSHGTGRNVAPRHYKHHDAKGLSSACGREGTKDITYVYCPFFAAARSRLASRNHHPASAKDLTWILSRVCAAVQHGQSHAPGCRESSPKPERIKTRQHHMS